MGSDWPIGTLKDIAEIEMGQSPPGDSCNIDSEGYPLLNGPTEFGGHHPYATQFTTDPKRFSKSGDVLFCVRGSTTGRMNWSNQKYAIGRGIAAIRHKNGLEFQPFIRGLIEFKLSTLLSSATGSTFPNVSKNQLFELKTYIPPLPEQKRIAHILGSLDDKIELNRQMNQTLEAMAQALFKSWFVNFDPVIDNALKAGNPIPEPLQKRAQIRQDLHKSGQAKPLPEHIQSLFPNSFTLTDEMGWVPEGWEVKPVSEAINVNPKVILPKGTVATFVDMKALPTSGYSVLYTEKKSYSGGAKFALNDVLLARITPCLENGKTALVDFLSGDEVGFGSTEFIVLRSKDNIGYTFIACLARDNVFREHCCQSMVGSSGRQRVQNSCFDDFYLAYPPDAKLLNLFEKQNKAAFDKVSSNKGVSNSFSKLRDTLLPKLISGELRIPEAEEQIKEAVA